jgi:hypothetical protein
VHRALGEQRQDRGAHVAAPTATAAPTAGAAVTARAETGTRAEPAAGAEAEREALETGRTGRERGTEAAPPAAAALAVLV